MPLVILRRMSSRCGPDSAAHPGAARTPGGGTIERKRADVKQYVVSYVARHEAGSVVVWSQSPEDARFDAQVKLALQRTPVRDVQVTDVCEMARECPEQCHPDASVNLA